MKPLGLAELETQDGESHWPVSSAHFTAALAVASASN
jgi:hypothetical protein